MISYNKSILDSNVCMDILFLIGRILFGGFFLYNGINHLNKQAALTGYAKSKKVPNPKAAVILGGLLLIVGGIGVLLGVYPEVALTSLLIFLVPTTFMMHAFWRSPEQERASEKIQFLKNMALIGAILMLYSLPWLG